MGRANKILTSSSSLGFLPPPVPGTVSSSCSRTFCSIIAPSNNEFHQCIAQTVFIQASKLSYSNQNKQNVNDNKNTGDTGMKLIVSLS